MKYIASKNFLNGNQKRVKVGDAVIQGTERDQYDEDAIKLYKNNGMIVTEEDFEKRQARNKELAEAQEKARTPSDEKSLKKALREKTAEVEALKGQVSELNQSGGSTSSETDDELQSEHTTLKANFKKLEDDMGELVEHRKTLDTQVSELTTARDKAEEENRGLASEKSSLEGKLGVSDKHLSDAKSEIESLQSENTELKEKSQKVVDKAVENQKALEMKISELEGELEELTKPVETDESDSKDVGGDKNKSTGPSKNK